ncbi:MAG: GntR family transcriptional regulator [Planctomycetaceae bacterium]|nr:MAG: GntR family transcriptional regulator [Planctomycetaceae bacterium]
MYNSIAVGIDGTEPWRRSIMFIRIEPSSSAPIYRQIMDQIKYQIAAGMLKAGDKVPSVRQLAGQLAVNQNTILKVYNELCREHVLQVDRGNGTIVAQGNTTTSMSERKKAVAALLREAAVQAIHLDISPEQTHTLLEKEYRAILAERAESLS